MQCPDRLHTTVAGLVSEPGWQKWENTRLTFRLPGEAIEAVQHLAEKRGVIANKI